jgi:hypothetical protein
VSTVMEKEKFCSLESFYPYFSSYSHPCFYSAPSSTPASASAYLSGCAASGGLWLGSH